MRNALCPKCRKHTIPKRGMQCPVCNHIVRGKRQREAKHVCNHCQGHIAFPADWRGREIMCPHCSLNIELSPPVSNKSSRELRAKKAASDFARIANQTESLNRGVGKNESESELMFFLRRCWEFIFGNEPDPFSSAFHVLKVCFIGFVFLMLIGGMLGGGGGSSDAEDKAAKEYIHKENQRSLDSIYREAVYGEEFRKANGRNPTQPEVDEYLKSRR